LQYHRAPVFIRIDARLLYTFLAGERIPGSWESRIQVRDQMYGASGRRHVQYVFSSQRGHELKPAIGNMGGPQHPAKLAAVSLADRTVAVLDSVVEPDSHKTFVLKRTRTVQV